jgi:hypothetical protein
MADDPNTSAQILPFPRPLPGDSHVDMRWAHRVMLLWTLNSLIDAAKHHGVTITAMKDAINTSTVANLLKPLGADLSYHGADAWREMHVEWQGMTEINERRKLRVQHNGICLLIAYVVEGLQLLRESGNAPPAPPRPAG